MAQNSSGFALEGLRIIELGAIGPGPHAATLLADLGADVVRVERPARPARPATDPTVRSRRRIEIDVNDATQLDKLRSLIAQADVLIDGFRPGATERMGVGPAEMLSLNPRLVYSRLTGWGQEGPLAHTAGHDINYLALTGALHSFSRDDVPPRAPLNVVADYGGGSLFLVVGILAALWEREKSGRGQVVDAAMVDGVSSMLQLVWALLGTRQWDSEPGTNVLDGGAPFYDTYRCADGRYIAVGAIEPVFFSALIRELGWPDVNLVVASQNDRAMWPTLRRRLAETFVEHDRDVWAARFGAIDACVTPVLSMAEAVDHPHMRARGTHVEREGFVHAAPAPRLVRSGSAPIRVARDVDVDAVVADWSLAPGHRA